MKCGHRIGVLGGTFDPVHCGHLRLALELAEQLALDRVLLIPAARPPHRVAPAASPERRLRMLELAVAGEPQLVVDARECRRAGASYSVDTLAELRAELGEEAALCFLVGADAFAGMASWHQWQRLPQLAHIVVVTRPGWRLPRDLGPMECWRDRFTDNSDTLAGVAAGRILFIALSPLDIAATRIRALISKGRSARYLLPDAVWAYIRQQHLYGFSQPGAPAKQE